MKLSRRNVIRGAAAAGVCAGAGLQHSISEAFACEPLGSNKRLVFYVSGNGQEPSQWAHDYDFDSPLPVMLAPLEEFRDDLLLVQGIGCSFTPGLHGNYFAPLSCVREPVLTDDDTEYWMRFPGGITFDRFMANELRGTTPLQSLVLAHPHRYSYDPASAPPSLPCSSADGPDTPVAPEWDPVAVYDAYFAGAGDDPAQEAAALRVRDRRLRLLQAAAGQPRNLGQAVEGRALEQLEQLEQSLDELGVQLNVDLTPCADFVRPEPIAIVDAEYDVRQDLIRNYMDLTYNALLCGLTNSVHISNDGGVFSSSHSKYPSVGDNYGLHKRSVGHGEDSVDPEMRSIILQTDIARHAGSCRGVLG